jgi:undecaprenyl phosphate N,N'-diacetylbacillosamine 1-phosphate transferase
MYLKIIKPFLDILSALIAFIIFTPLFLVILILLAINNNGKPFFFQKRPGKNGEIFKVIKFKTMSDKKDKAGVLLPDAKRLTLVGKFIRKTSLDEIPQLINVIKGDMSLIGPRPLLPEYLKLYSKVQHKRHLLKPGITGWAQVNGRNAISWTKKLDYDVWYVENVNIFLDIRILFKTVGKVIKSEDINTENQATTVRFNGNN